MTDQTPFNERVGGADSSVPARQTHIRDYGLILLNRWPVIVTALVIGIALTWFVTQRQVRLYRTSALLRLTPPSRGVVRQFGPAPGSIVTDPVELVTLLALVQLPDTVERAVRDFDLESKPDFDGMTFAEIVRAANGRITAKRRRGQYLVDVSATGPKPEILDDLANAVVHYFANEQSDKADMARKQRRADLKERIASVRGKIQIAEIDMRGLLRDSSHTEASFDDLRTRLQGERTTLSRTLSDLAFKRLNDQATYVTLKAAVDSGAYDSVRLHRSVRLDGAVVTVSARIERATATMHDLTVVKQLGSGHQSVQRVTAELNRAQQELRVLERAIVRDFVSEYDSNLARQRQVETRKTDVETELTEMSTIGNELDENRSLIDRYRVEVTELREDLDGLGPETLLVGGTVFVVREAREPDPNRPVSPNVALNYTLGSILSLLVGVTIAFLIEYLDDTIRTKDELAKVTEVQLLGVIPYIKGSRSDTSSKDLVAYKYPKDTVAEAYRGVRTSLTLSARGRDRRVLLFTSAGPREGKTTTVINVATVFSYADADTRVLVIDADLRKPRVHASFGIEDEDGLSNALMQKVPDPVPLCQETQVKNVDVLTSGPIPPNPSELLGSQKMAVVLKRLRDVYDYVLLDTPPIGAVTDAAVLGTLVDGVILVVHAGKTRRGVVSRGLEQLRYIHAPVEGVILNNLRTGRRGYYAGYYNYYYYYSYYGTGSSREERTASKSAKE